MKFFWLFSILLVIFCLPGSGSGFRIRIQSGSRSETLVSDTMYNIGLEWEMRSSRMWVKLWARRAWGRPAPGAGPRSAGPAARWSSRGAGTPPCLSGSQSYPTRPPSPLTQKTIFNFTDSQYIMKVTEVFRNVVDLHHFNADPDSPW